MSMKSRVWYPVAVAFTALNIASAGYAAGLEDPGHAAVHVGLTAVGALWAYRLGRRRSSEAAGYALTDGDVRFQALEEELDVQRRELAEAQERLDFAERLLSQREIPR